MSRMICRFGMPMILGLLFSGCGSGDPAPQPETTGTIPGGEAVEADDSPVTEWKPPSDHASRLQQPVQVGYISIPVPEGFVTEEALGSPPPGVLATETWMADPEKEISFMTVATFGPLPGNQSADAQNRGFFDGYVEQAKSQWSDCKLERVERGTIDGLPAMRGYLQANDAELGVVKGLAVTFVSSKGAVAVSGWTAGEANDSLALIESSALSCRVTR
jgi:hypothetical protein